MSQGEIERANEVGREQVGEGESEGVREGAKVGCVFNSARKRVSATNRPERT